VEPLDSSGALPPPPPPPRRWEHPVLYPDRYAWYVLASVLDITVTVSVLVHYGAREVNSFAQASIELFGTWGLIALKFLTLAIVVAICEFVGRRHLRLGRVLATIAILASLLPVLSAASQVFVLWSRGDLAYTDWPRPVEETPAPTMLR
jgi:hypothetical protein